MRLPLSRRLMLGGLAGSLLARPGLGTAWAEDAGRGITVGCWAGLYGETLGTLVDAPFTHATAIAVRQLTGPEPQRVSAILAPGRDAAPLDVAMLSDTDAYRLSLGQVFVPITTDGVSSLPKIVSRLRTPYGIPQARTALSIAYNANKLSEPPRGFATLFEAAKRGEAGFSSEIAIHNLAAGAISQHRPQASLDAAKAIFAALKKAGTLRIYPTNEALGEALASGSITMAPMWRSRAYVWRKEGRDIKNSTPVEGAVPFTIMACVPKQSERVASAMHYLEALLNPDTQSQLAERLGLLPTIDTARVDAKLMDQIGFTLAQQARFRPLALAAVARNGLALRRFWDRDLV